MGTGRPLLASSPALLVWPGPGLALPLSPSISWPFWIVLIRRVYGALKLKLHPFNHSSPSSAQQGERSAPPHKQMNVQARGGLESILGCTGQMGGENHPRGQQALAGCESGARSGPVARREFRWGFKHVILLPGYMPGQILLTLQAGGRQELPTKPTPITPAEAGKFLKLMLNFKINIIRIKCIVFPKRLKGQND